MIKYQRAESTLSKSLFYMITCNMFILMFIHHYNLIYMCNAQYNTFTTYYKGLNNKQYKIKIREPNDNNNNNNDNKYPVYVYTTGTTMCESGQYGSYAYKIDNRFMEEMAKRGFIAATVEYPCATYPTSCQGIENKVKYIYGDGSTTTNDDSMMKTALSILCQRTNANCSKGVAVHGYSQGAHIAYMAKKYDKRISASLLFGNGAIISGQSAAQSSCLQYYDNSSAINERLGLKQMRSIVGENDIKFGSNLNGVIAQQQAFSGYNYNNNYCSTTDKRNCLQSDGSGYFIVPNGAHGFFYNHGFILKDIFLENDPSLQWGIKMNFDWLSKTSKLFAVVISNDDNTNINKNQDEIKKTPAEECTESKDMPNGRRRLCRCDSDCNHVNNFCAEGLTCRDNGVCDDGKTTCNIPLHVGSMLFWLIFVCIMLLCTGGLLVAKARNANNNNRVIDDNMQTPDVNNNNMMMMANSTMPVASVVQQIELGPLQTIDVLVPSGVLPGQILQVQTPKGIVQLQIQPGMEPGTTVQVHI